MGQHWNSSKAAELNLPVVDLAGSYESLEGFRNVAGQVDQVCRDSGFFYVVNHQVPQALIEDMFRASAVFFDLPAETKQSIIRTQSRTQRGWSPIGAQSLDTGKPADLMEGFSAGLECDPSDPIGENLPRRGGNLWPGESAVPGLRHTVLNYMAALDRTARHIMSLIAVGLDLPPDYFETFMRRPAPTIRLLRYPPHPCDADANQSGAGAHTDWGALTLLVQDSKGGLQVQDRDGQWQDVLPVAGSFVVNLGDLMARWTNDAYTSTRHRVINNVSDSNRYSIPFFFEVDYDARVAALPGCFGPDNPARYPVITAGEHHAEKMRLARLDG